MTLEDFIQRRTVIPVHEQIWLVGNPLFHGRYPSRFSDAIRPGLISELVRWFGQEWSKRLLQRLPQKAAVLFAGLPDRSMDSLETLTQTFQKIRANPGIRCAILIGKGDYELDADFARGLPDNVLRVFGNNVNVDHEKVRFFPMGRDFRSVGVFMGITPTPEKRYLCYANYSLNTHPCRSAIYESIRQIEWIEFDHMGRFLEYSMSRKDFYWKLAAAKFAICPRGNALDTFRLWDCLYCGTIPIVVHEAVFHRELEDLPILFIDTPDDYRLLTREYLEDKYLEMSAKSYNYAKLQLSYWWSLVEKDTMEPQDSHCR